MMDVYTFSVHKVGLSISGIIAQMLFSIEKDQASESQLLVMLMVTETLKSSSQKRISFMSWHMLVSNELVTACYHCLKWFWFQFSYSGTEKQADGRQGGSRRDHGHTTRLSTAVIILFSLARMFL